MYRPTEKKEIEAAKKIRFSKFLKDFKKLEAPSAHIKIIEDSIFLEFEEVIEKRYESLVSIEKTEKKEGGHSAEESDRETVLRNVYGVSRAKYIELLREALTKRMKEDWIVTAQLELDIKLLEENYEKVRAAYLSKDGDNLEPLVADIQKRLSEKRKKLTEWKKAIGCTESGGSCKNE